MEVDGYRPFPSLPHKNALQEAFEVPTLVRLLRLPAGRDVLEIGCGRGVALPPLARLTRPRRLVGVDVDAAALADARDHLAAEGVAAQLVEADARSLPFPDASFDVVVDFGTCYHIERAEQALAEIARVLRPNGVFVHETRASQLLAHPARALGKSLPWRAVNELAPARTALLWKTKVKR